MPKTFAPLLATAAIGGVVGAGAAIAVDVARDDSPPAKTVVQQAPIGGSQPASDASALTPRDIYKRDAPGVVSIKAQIVRQVQSPFDMFPSEQQGLSSGSGFVVDKKGYILTNYHVVEGASKVTVSFGDKQTTDAQVVGKDPSDDIALLKIKTDGLSLHPLELGSAGPIQVGDPTIAIGNPFGLDRTLTTGVVSALQRRIQAPNGFTIANVIQTDAPINPGNSGGPLIDAAGRVIGINSQIATGGAGQGNVGIGFAVPIDTAKRIIPELKKSGRVRIAFLGINGATIDSSLNALNLAVKKGVLVQTVTKGSPADKAGLQGGTTSAALGGNQISLGGDVITKLDGKPVTSMDGIANAVSSHKPGDKVTLEIVRGGKTKTLTVTLANRPATPTTH